MDKLKTSSLSPDVIDKVLSNPELTKTLLGQDDGEARLYTDENCRIIFCPGPANLKFVLCDVEIDSQEYSESNKAQAKEKFLLGKEFNAFRKEIRSLKDELIKNNILLENIHTILKQKNSMPDNSF